MRRLVLVFTCFACLTLVPILTAQDNPAPSVCIASDVAQAARAACADMQPGEACYGAGDLTAELTDSGTFTEVGDRVPLASVARLTGTPGALAFLQTGDAALILYGGASLANDAPVLVEPYPEITVRNPSNLPLNLRNAPGTYGGVIGTLGRGESLLARGRSADGAWLHVEFDGRMAWIAASVVEVEGDAASLYITDGDAAPPMQRVTLGAGACAGLLVHADDAALLTVNGAALMLDGGTMALSEREDALWLALIDGALSVGEANATAGAWIELLPDAPRILPNALREQPTDAPLAALPESVALCVTADGSTPAGCQPDAVVQSAPQTTPAPMSVAPANASFAHAYLPAGQSVWQAYTGPDTLSGACETPPIAACDHLSAVIVNPDGTISWRGQEPQPYTMTPIGIDQFFFQGRNGLNDANITLNFTFAQGAWSGTMQYVFDRDPDCTHTFYYTAQRLR